MNITPIAHIKTQFPDKFGIPRQAGLADTVGKIVFEPEYRVPEALRGIEEYSHLWLIWEFTRAKQAKWSPTVRPPRLGGNVRMGVFATRSPFRPNSIGLSCVKLIGIEQTREFGNVLIVSGADLLNDTPIYDIKPYLPFTDAHPDALDGFAGRVLDRNLQVEFLVSADILSEQQKITLIQILSQDPRPHYQHDENRYYSFEFDGFHVSFSVNGTVLSVSQLQKI